MVLPTIKQYLKIKIRTQPALSNEFHEICKHDKNSNWYHFRQIIKLINDKLHLYGKQQWKGCVTNSKSSKSVDI